METILGIPGKWADESEFLNATALNSDSYIFDNNKLINTKTNKSYNVLLHKFHPSLLNAFYFSGEPKLSDEDKAEVENLTYTAYLIAEIENMDDTRELVKAAEVLLHSGGLAVKVETSAIMHNRNEWLGFARTMKNVNLFQAFVAIVRDNTGFVSYGMQMLGLPNAQIVSEPDEYAYLLLRTFLFHLFTEKPTFNNNDEFSLYEGEPLYRLEKGDDTKFPKDDLFYNPYGLWTIAPAEQPKKE